MSSNLTSEVTQNQRLICVGDSLTYIDAANFDKWEVTELFDGGFEAKSGDRTEDFYFSSLQIGWYIADATKRKHEQEDRFEYRIHSLIHATAKDYRMCNITA